MSFLLAWFLLGLLCVSALYYILSVGAARRLFSSTSPPVLSKYPPVSILKPLKGAPHDLYDTLATFCRLDYPSLQIIFGVREPEDPAVSVVKQIQKKFPACDISLVVEPHVIGENYKVSTLHHLLLEAKYDHLVITDSDVTVDPDYLCKIIPPLTKDETGLVTCIYRGGASRPLPALIESIMIETSFITQVIVASQIEKPSYAFGATIAVKRHCLESIGGFAPLRNFLADDYYLGFNLARTGVRIQILPTIVETHPDVSSFTDLFHHQIRWGRTQRNCRPGGYLSTAVTFGTVWAGLTLLCLWPAPEICAAAFGVIFLRMVSAFFISTIFLKSTLPWASVLLVPLTDFLSFFVWLNSLWGTTVRWGPYTFRVRSNGTMTRVN